MACQSPVDATAEAAAEVEAPSAVGSGVDALEAGVSWRTEDAAKAEVEATGSSATSAVPSMGCAGASGDDSGDGLGLLLGVGDIVGDGSCDEDARSERRSARTHATSRPDLGMFSICGHGRHRNYSEAVTPSATTTTTKTASTTAATTITTTTTTASIVPSPQHTRCMTARSLCLSRPSRCALR